MNRSRYIRRVRSVDHGRHLTVQVLGQLIRWHDRHYPGEDLLIPAGWLAEVPKLYPRGWQVRRTEVRIEVP